mmetsp:Transcript_3463/g.7451  ORF Transcript_3463/g.7451 Transcript_3463/m.7451 type:complete len:97 (+) Transcript_3463:452-742(+)
MTISNFNPHKLCADAVSQSKRYAAICAELASTKKLVEKHEKELDCSGGKFVFLWGPWGTTLGQELLVNTYATTIFVNTPQGAKWMMVNVFQSNLKA